MTIPTSPRPRPGRSIREESARMRAALDHLASLHTPDDDRECQECGAYWPCASAEIIARGLENT